MEQKLFSSFHDSRMSQEQNHQAQGRIGVETFGTNKIQEEMMTLYKELMREPIPC
jgi:hypothetical protein